MIDETLLIKELYKLADEEIEKCEQMYEEKNFDMLMQHKYGECCFYKAIQKTKDIPKVYELITCDQLPKESGDYLVWYGNGDDEEGCMVMNFDAGIGDFGYWCYEYDENTLRFLDRKFIYFKSAVAWQPLPEPYKGVEE